MRQLWAPWRMEYVGSGGGGACIFCEAPAKDPDESLLLFSGSLSLVVLNRFPYNSGHLLIAPRRHVARLDELTPEESLDIFRLMRHSTVTLTRALAPAGFNIGLNLGSASGAGIIDHIHFHVVPRWNGDSNFMPVLADVKVIPEHLLATRAKLAPLFVRLE